MVEDQPGTGLGIRLEEAVDVRHKALLNRTPPKEHHSQESDGASILDERMNVNKGNESSSNADGFNAEECNKGNESSSKLDGLNAESNESSSNEDGLNAENNEGNEGIDLDKMFGHPIMYSNMFNPDHVATGPDVSDWRTSKLPKSPFKVSQKHAFKDGVKSLKKSCGEKEDKDANSLDVEDATQR
jgi:hypothetical protein